MRLNVSKGLLSGLLMVVFASFAFSQAVITGNVVDGDNFPISGAQVNVLGTASSVNTQTDGSFSITTEAGEGILEILDISNGTQQVSFTGVDGETLNLGTIALSGEGVSLGSMVVVGRGVIDLEEDRKTPVAVSTVFREEILDKAQGNVEFPEILENTPNVYVSNQAGGFGDSQMYLRGFDQTNTAFLLNGQPINGMEDGRMYWSNWSGITDIANAVQVQRGLGSSKLAISSVGGTVNIVTKATDKKQGGYVQGLVGNDSYFKGSVGYNTGLVDKWAFSIALSHWQAHRKYARGTYGNGQSYFMSVGFKPNDTHNFNFLVTGAPQLHGQNFSKNMTGARSYETYGTKWNSNFGFLDGEQFSWRQNYYHKPILNLNWDFDISDKSYLSTVLYASFGRGGGTGPAGDATRPFGSYAPIDYFRDGADQYYTESGDFNFDLLQQNNINNVENGAGSFGNGIIRRSSVNNHNWYGLVSNFNHDFSDELSLNVGFDGRMYKGTHFQQVNDFLGLTSWDDSFRRHESLGENIVTASYEANPWAALFNYADEDERISYDYSEKINYLGGFGQLEYATERFSTFFQGAVSTQSYQREGRWADLGESDKINKIGYNVKGGASVSINDENKLFANAGYYSRQPFLDNIFDNVRYSSTLVDPEVENELITGFEAGYQYQTNNLKVNLNAYYSKWDNRFFQAGGQEYTASNGNLYSRVQFLYTEVGQLHKGLELDFDARVNRNFNVRGYVTYGDWNYDGTTPFKVREEEQNQTVDSGEVDLTGVKVGEAPQVTAGFGTKWNITRNFSWDADLNIYGKFFGFVDVEDLVEAVRKGEEYQVEKIDDYALVNTGLTYKFKFGNQDIKLRGNVRNLFNHNYISQQDSYGYYFGNGRTWNASVTYNF